MSRDQRSGGSDRRSDLALAAVLLAALEVAVVVGGHRRVPVVPGVLLVAGMTVPVVWRRSAPLGFAAVTVGLAVALLTDVASTVAGLYVLLIPAYTVAAFASQTRALIGLAVCVAGPWGIDALAGRRISDWVFTAGISLAAWATGRALRARRRLAEQLKRNARRIVAERETRLRLAIADERSRIARELQALVAGSVSAMVLQAEAAQRLLEDDPVAADEVMAAAEETGRQALAEMRRVLGVLRRAEESAELTPQPGLGQIHTLVERARQGGRTVELAVEGEPWPLPASAELGVYRMIEDALADVESIVITLRFGERDVQLEMTTTDPHAPDWPTLAMHERVALSQGKIESDDSFGARTLHVRIPLLLDGALA